MSIGQASTKRVMVVYGTRPEAIKLAPVIRAIGASSRLRPVVTLTGQHRTIVDQVNSMFGIRPDHNLDVIRPRQSLHGLTARVLERLSPALQQERPDAVVVQGDTTSAFAGALAAFYEHVPVVHVEAGLRTGDLYSPFPEEANRRLTGQIATLHLAPTPVSEGNLLRDGISSRKVMVTGNTVIDALLWTVQQHVPYGDPVLEAIDSTDAPILLVTAHRRESWGQRMRDVASAVARLARKHPDLIVVLPLHPNPVVREALLPALRGRDNVMLVEPMAYGAFARLLQRSTIVLTDSGGVQEEAPSLGKPVLVMRDTTERPEAVSAGTARLVGTDPERVFSAVDELLTFPRAYETMANAVNPYGDGHAAQRTAKAIEHMFGFGSRPVPFGGGASELRLARLLWRHGLLGDLIKTVSDAMTSGRRQNGTPSREAERRARRPGHPARERARSSRADAEVLPGESGPDATVEVDPHRIGPVRMSYSPQTDGAPDPGEVVWTWVPFEENDGRGKDRPVLVVAVEPAGTYLAVQLTSKDHDGQGDFVSVGAGGWDGEHRPSWVNLDRVIRVHEGGMRREAAALPREPFERVTGRLQQRYGWR